MEAGKTYHIYTHANGSENLFQTDENFRYFLKRYEEYIPPVADTLAWCLMPNHVHLLVQIKSSKDLTKDLTGLAGGSKKDLSGLEKTLERLTILQFSHLFNAYTKAYNKFKKKRRGSLFTRAFKRQEITSDRYFTNIIHYIHHNPVHHGFVKHIKDWPWSSYHDFLLPNLTPAQQKVIDWFGNRDQFILFHNQTLGATPEITDHD